MLLQIDLRIKDNMYRHHPNELLMWMINRLNISRQIYKAANGRLRLHSNKNFFATICQRNSLDFCQPRVSSKLIALQAITKIFIKALCYLVNEDLKLYVGVDGVGFGDRQVQFGQRFKIIILTKSYHKITILAWD